MIAANASRADRKLTHSPQSRFAAHTNETGGWLQLSIRQSLFVAQGHHRVNLSGAARGDVASEQRGEQKYGGDGANNGRIHRVDLIKERFHQAADEVGAAEAEKQSAQREEYAFAENQAKHLRGARAQGYAQADFVSALRDSERHDAIDSDGGQQECNGGKTPKQNSAEAISGERFVDNLVHCLDLIERQIGIDGKDDGSDALGHAGRISRRVNRDSSVRTRTLREGNIDLREAVSTNAAIVDVMVDPDDLPFDRRAQFGLAGDQLLDREALFERIEIREIFLDECVVDDGDGHIAGKVLTCENAALGNGYAEGTKVFWSDHGKASAGARGEVTDGLADDGEGHSKIGALQRHAGTNGNRRNAGERADLFEKLAVEGVDLLGFGEAIGGNREAEGENVILSEAEIDARQFPKAVNDEAGAG